MNKDKRNNEKIGLYRAIDNAIMRGVNGGVRAWNWTTGRTKADLANTMLTIAPILESVGWINLSQTIGICMTGLCLSHSHHYQKENIKMEEMESKALSIGAMDLEVEKYKSTAHPQPLLWIVTAALFVANDHKNGSIVPDRTQTDYCTALGSTIRAGSLYVMRADYLPPQKNILSRAADRTRELLRGFQAQPAGAPASAGRSLTSVRDLKRA